jgi:DNA-binding CsgD family transcriptional regulator
MINGGSRLRQVDAIAGAIGVLSPNAFRHGADLVECLVSTGETAAAEARLAELAERVGAARLPWGQIATHRARATVLAARGRLDAALIAATDAADQAGRLGIPFEHGRCLLTLSTVHRRRRSKAAAAAALDQACTIFGSLGAAPWTALVDRERDRLGARRQRTQSLTPTERLVAELAAAGATNPEISARLSMSRKTVEFNLSKVYRKLGIRNRAQLSVGLVRL